MNLHKKVSLSFLPLMVISSLAACSSNNVVSSANFQGNVDFSKTNIVSNATKVTKTFENGTEHILADVGAVKDGASISVKLNLNNGGEFKTKAATNSSGTAAATTGQIQSVKVWLVDMTPVNPITPGTLIPSGNVKKVVSFDTTNASSTITFTNVGTSTGSYYVAVAAYNNNSANQTPANNISNSTSAPNRVMFGSAYPFQWAAISQLGGDSAPSSNIGSVSVGASPSFTVSSTAGLNVGLTLADNTGATIQADATATGGGAFGGSIGSFIQ